MHHGCYGHLLTLGVQELDWLHLVASKVLKSGRWLQLHGLGQKVLLLVIFDLLRASEFSTCSDALLCDEGLLE